MARVLHVDLFRALRCREISGAKMKVVDKIRAEGLTNQETIGRPIVLFRDSTFMILIGGNIEDLAAVPLRTLRAFSEDIHGGGRDPADADRLDSNRTLDCENLTSSEFLALTKVVAAYIEAEEKKKEKVDEAVACIAKAP
jgi:hypothetical protein|tara:strand:+ start:323 stop:742 length:420 start_codon:yes stop_codon:yes gene_type:complete